MHSFDIATCQSIIKPPKELRNLRFPREKLIKKKFSYSNTTTEPKTIEVSCDSEHIIVKNPKITINPMSQQDIKLRMLFSRSAAESQHIDIQIRCLQSGDIEEQIRLNIVIID